MPGQGCAGSVSACPGTHVSQDTVHVSQYGVRASRDAEACPGTGLCQQRVRVSQEARVPGRVGGVPVQCEGVPGRGHVCWDTGVPKIWSVSRDTSCPRTRFGVPGHDKPAEMTHPRRFAFPFAFQLRGSVSRSRQSGFRAAPFVWLASLRAAVRTALAVACALSYRMT